MMKSRRLSWAWHERGIGTHKENKIITHRAILSSMSLGQKGMLIEYWSESQKERGH
jgi:hypothetical protein